MKRVLRSALYSACFATLALGALLAGSQAYAQSTPPAGWPSDYPYPAITVTIEKPGVYNLPPPPTTLEPGVGTIKPVVYIDVLFLARSKVEISNLSPFESITVDPVVSIACDNSAVIYTSAQSAPYTGNANSSGFFDQEHPLFGKKNLEKESIHTVSASAQWRYSRASQGSTNYTPYTSGQFSNSSHLFQAQEEIPVTP